MVIGFALVIRVQIAYQRFWEGATNLRTMSSKLADAVMQLVAFDETPGNLALAREVQPAVFDERGIEFRLQTITSPRHASPSSRSVETGGHELSVNTGDPSFPGRGAQRTQEQARIGHPHDEWERQGQR